jgi:hypothetical protein
MAGMPTTITSSRGHTRAKNADVWQSMALGLLLVDAAMWLYVASLPAKLLG